MNAHEADNQKERKKKKQARISSFQLGQPKKAMMTVTKQPKKKNNKQTKNHSNE